MDKKQKNIRKKCRWIEKSFFTVVFLIYTLAISSCIKKVPSADELPKAGNYPNADTDSTVIQRINPTRSMILNKSHQKLGIPYLYGGSTPRAFDCSGLTQYVYREAGINIPRTTKLQLLKSQTIPYQQLLPGDLAFYKTGAKSRHVGIYIGNNQMIHASTGSKRVRTTNITDSYWRQRFTKFGRFVKNN